MAGQSLGRYREALEREKRRSNVSDCDLPAVHPSELISKRRVRSGWFKSPQILRSHRIQGTHSHCSEMRRAGFRLNVLPWCRSRTISSERPRTSRQHDFANGDGNQERILEPSCLCTSDRCLVCSYLKPYPTGPLSREHNFDCRFKLMLRVWISGPEADGGSEAVGHLVP
jgi:hypothetical protein